MRVPSKLSNRIALALTSAWIAVGATAGAAPAAAAGGDGGRIYYSAANLPGTQVWVSPGPWLVIWPSDIYSINPDGTQGKLHMSGDTPKVSPDGRYLAYEEKGDIWVTLANGSSPGSRVLATEEQIEFWPSWSPDGKSLAFIQWNGVGSSAYSAVVTINVDGSGLRRVTDSPTPVEQAPTWSPDGRWIAFARTDYQEPDSAQHIYLVRPDGSRLRRLTHGRLSAHRPRWSPDSRYLVFEGWIQGDPVDRTTENENVYVISARGGEARKITEGAAADTTPCWSPDGKRIAFSRQINDVESWSGEPGTFVWTGTPADLYSVAIDGSSLRQITNTPHMSEHECDWSYVATD